MEKRTLKFDNLVDLARFSKIVANGYLMNTNNYTLTGKFSDSEVRTAVAMYSAKEIETTDKVFTY